MRIVCTVGDSNGIGLEVWAKALYALRRHSVWREVTLALVAHPRTVAEYAQACGLPLRVRDTIFQIGQLRGELIACSTYAPVRWGYPDPVAAQQAWEALDIALELAQRGQLDAVVTLPITKHALYLLGWRYPGQTEYLAHPYANYSPIMLFVADSFRVALLTTHVPLRQVPLAVTAEGICSFVCRLCGALEIDFGLEHPRMALLGLNPHAGENGMLGKEELGWQAVLERLRQEGYFLEGPFAADAYFGRQRWRQYDVTIALYHDQGLVPFKLLAQGKGVNVTLGLPFVRTSPDHGSAYDIAGQGVADPSSMQQALLLAAELVRRRYACGMLPLRRRAL